MPMFSDEAGNGDAEGDDMLASASGDQTIRVWDMMPGRPEAVATLRGHKGSVKSVQFRPHSRFELVSGARGGDIILWDTRVGQGVVSALSVKVGSCAPVNLSLSSGCCPGCTITSKMARRLLSVKDHGQAGHGMYACVAAGGHLWVLIRLSQIILPGEIGAALLR